MKDTSIILACLAVLFVSACSKPETPVVNPDGSVDITVVIDPENGTKATLAEVGGAFEFSSGDEISLGIGSTRYDGRNDFDGHSGNEVFRVPGLRNVEGQPGGFAAFPAGLVKTISGTSVTFTLPKTYTYEEVGGTDPDAAKVPCPMIGDYVAGAKVALKQAGAVIRFKLTNNSAGTLTFTFPENVTGVTNAITATPTETGVGGITSIASSGGKVITVSGVPAGSVGAPVYITLPVLNGTSPNGIVVINNPSDAGARQSGTIATGSALARGKGYKTPLSVSDVNDDTSFTINDSGDRVVLAPGNLMAHIGSYSARVATADEWKFGGFFEYVGGAADSGNYLFAHNNAECVGKWVDLFRWQGASCTNPVRGLCNSAYDAAYNGSEGSAGPPSVEESLYENCWNTDTYNAESPANGGIHITNGGSHTWRMLTHDEWEYILGKRKTSTLNGVENARCARATVAGVKGLLIFPDNIGDVWNVGTMGDYPDDTNRCTIVWTYDEETGMWTKTNVGQTNYGWSRNYTATQMVALANAGVIFLPSAGYLSVDIVNETGDYGYYWTSTSTTHPQRAWYVNFNKDELTPVGGWTRHVGRAVRLARDVPPEILGSPALGNTGLATDWE